MGTKRSLNVIQTIKHNIKDLNIKNLSIEKLKIKTPSQMGIDPTITIKTKSLTVTVELENALRSLFQDQ